MNESTAPSSTDATRPRAGARLPVIGIGASAGGLEALELFLTQVPAESGEAFVVVQHLDPHHKGMMVELLQRSCKLPVAQVVDRMPIAPGRVYVIPPNCDLSIVRGVLHLHEPTERRGLRLPIDSFLRSLAADAREASIGVILSGMGSDGTLGLRAIKEQSGAAFVQSLESAKFDGMPHSAIDAGLADVIAPVEELYGKIIAYLRHTPFLSGVPAPLLEAADEADRSVEEIVQLLRDQTGHDFSLYKQTTLTRRIERRMGLHRLHDRSDYVRYVRENPTEGRLLFNELLIGVTSFFRDPEVWAQLKAEVFPALFASRADGSTLRAWVAGCSTGEEAYSLAMTFAEAVAESPTPLRLSLQIFATDLDKDAIEAARAGAYPLNITADVSDERLQRFFVLDGSRYRVTRSLRDMVIFAPHNLVMDPPFTRLDVLSCRNLLIYFTSELQQKLLPRFHYSLRDGGFLMLGGAETIGAATRLFAPLDGKTRLFRRLDAAIPFDHLASPSFIPRALPRVTESSAPKSPANLQTIAEQLLWQRHAPAAVVVTEQGDIVYVSGKTGRYLEPAAGKANWNVLAMAREGLNHALVDAFRRAVRQQEPVTLRHVAVETDGHTHHVQVSIEPLTEPREMRGMLMVVLTEVLPPPAADPVAHTGKRKGVPRADGPTTTELTQALEVAQLAARAAQEDAQASREELTAANEELQSINEELQSTNEELTTSKEELQSMNEELQTVNHELTARLDELTLASSDMTNLLNSTSIATLFLDNELRVRRFTTPTANIIHLIPSDVGRPITDIVSALDFADMEERARGVLRSLAVMEREISARDGRWFSVRIMPYRTHDDRIDGLVLTFTDITKAKELEAALRAAQESLQQRLATQRHDQSDDEQRVGTDGT